MILEFFALLYSNVFLKNFEPSKRKNTIGTNVHDPYIVEALNYKNEVYCLNDFGCWL